MTMMIEGVYEVAKFSTSHHIEAVLQTQQRCNGDCIVMQSTLPVRIKKLWQSSKRPDLNSSARKGKKPAYSNRLTLHSSRFWFPVL